MFGSLAISDHNFRMGPSIQIKTKHGIFDLQHLRQMIEQVNGAALVMGRENEYALTMFEGHPEIALPVEGHPNWKAPRIQFSIDAVTYSVNWTDNERRSLQNFNELLLASYDCVGSCADGYTYPDGDAIREWISNWSNP